MSMSLDCARGKSFRLKRELPAGRTLPCPGCGRILTIPKPPPEDALEDAAFEALTAGLPPEPEPYDAAPPPLPALPSTSPVPIERQQPQSRPRPAAWNVSSPPGAPAQARRQPRVVFEQGWFGSVNSGVLGGLLMMVIAVVWFVLGLAADTIFFYPPILLVIGLVSTPKGLGGGGD